MPTKPAFATANTLSHWHCPMKIVCFLYRPIGIKRLKQPAILTTLREFCACRMTTGPQNLSQRVILSLAELASDDKTRLT